MVTEQIREYNEPLGDIGGRVLGLCLLKAEKLLYMGLRISWKQC